MNKNLPKPNRSEQKTINEKTLKLIKEREKLKLKKNKKL